MEVDNGWFGIDWSRIGCEKPLAEVDMVDVEGADGDADKRNAEQFAGRQAGLKRIDL